jgi:hypothetical protein
MEPFQEAEGANGRVQILLRSDEASPVATQDQRVEKPISAGEGRRK